MNDYQIEMVRTVSKSWLVRLVVGKERQDAIDRLIGNYLLACQRYEWTRADNDALGSEVNRLTEQLGKAVEARETMRHRLEAAEAEAGKLAELVKASRGNENAVLRLEQEKAALEGEFDHKNKLIGVLAAQRDEVVNMNRRYAEQAQQQGQRAEEWMRRATAAEDRLKALQGLHNQMMADVSALAGKTDSALTNLRRIQQLAG